MHIIKKQALENEEGNAIEITGSLDQKLVVPLRIKDAVCMDLVFITIKKLEKSGIKDPSIKDVLEVLMDTYWWLQTITILFNKDEPISEETIIPVKGEKL